LLTASGLNAVPVGVSFGAATRGRADLRRWNMMILPDYHLVEPFKASANLGM
jgi:hypothetical protein